jgi:hypothetical protein
MSQFYVFGKLYARPSFIEGVARNVDILNTLREYNESPNEVEADIAALKNDWQAVGDDLRSSVTTYEQHVA